MLDCIIKGGTVIDGTGAGRVLADVGISNGRITAVGSIADSARRTIDATGLVVSPGFIDVHTHYDAQVKWDPALTPSSIHGVTTVIGGNCGFTLAPVSDDSIDYVTRMLACVEGMPVEALQAALKFDWRTYAEWLSTLEGKLGLNAGFMAGHSTIRRLVMGNDWKRAATDTEVAAMAAQVEEAVRAGALGFSSSWGGAHGDHEGNPVPSRFAEQRELVQLAGVLKKFPGTRLEFIPPTTSTTFTEETITLMANMSAAAGTSLNWNVLAVGQGGTEAHTWARIGAHDEAAKLGGQVFALALPIPLQVRINLRTTLVFNAIDLFRDALSMPREAKYRALADPAVRRQIAETIVREGHATRITMDFANLTIDGVGCAQLESLVGRAVGDIAKERGCAPIDAFLDIALEDDLDTWFLTPAGGSDEASWKLRARVWDDPRTLVGASDAGAHLDSTTSFAFFTDFVGPSVRERKLISLEEAVRKVTDMPARFYGLKNRGRLSPGFCADIVIFDPATVRTGSTAIRSDLPGGQSRIYAEAIGVKRVIVGGSDVVVDGKLTGALPGTLLRSGRDTG